MKRWNQRQYFSHWLHCFGFFVCPCYSRRTPVAQNIAACENQGMQPEFGDHSSDQKKKKKKKKKKDTNLRNWLKYKF